MSGMSATLNKGLFISFLADWLLFSLTDDTVESDTFYPRANA